jgi:hypothetical protein
MTMQMNTRVGGDWNDELKIVYDDDADQEQAGQGLGSFPLVYKALGQNSLRYWMMSPAEQVAMLFLLEHLRPKVAIEIGTRFGGSLQVLAKNCERIYSLDIDPEVPRRLEGKYPNVEYLIGPSDETLPRLIERLQREGAELSFALVDGNHSTDGVRKDIDNLLRFRPRIHFYIVMHDSFMPECRAGLEQANWAANPHVHAVELDFVSGIVNPAPMFRNILCGGLALGILLPSPRQGRFEITARSALTIQAALASLNPRRSLVRRAASKAKRMLLGR